MTQTPEHPNFEQAVLDYFELLNRGYPEERTRQLVADHFRLKRSERTLLFRGVFPDRVNRFRISRRASLPFGEASPVTVDFLNVILVLMNYLYGRRVFISSDLFARDTGENYRRFDSRDIFLRAARLLRKSLPEVGASSWHWLIDAHPAVILPQEILDHEALLMQLQVPGTEVSLKESDHVDRKILDIGKGVIASSDSGILDRTPLQIMDLAGYILSRYFDPGPENIHTLLYGGDKNASNTDRYESRRIENWK